MPTMGALPAPGVVKPRKRLTPLQTYSVAAKTIADAETSWITASLDSTVPGIWAGKLTPSGREFTLYDTSVPGNANGGHDYGTSLSDAEKAAIVEYMKTF